MHCIFSIVTVSFSLIYTLPVDGQSPVAGGKDGTVAKSPSLDVQRESAINMLIKQFRAIRAIPGLVIKYRIDNNPIDRTTKYFWAYLWSDYEQKITFAKPQVHSVRRYPLSYTDQPPKKGYNERIQSTDGVYYLQMYPSAIASAGLSPLTEICINTLRGDLQYFLFIACPTFPETDITQAHRLARAPDKYWLPETLEKHGSEYKARGEREVVQGTPCLVLERKGVDILWVQTSPYVAIRKRQVYFNDQQVREIFEYGDYREVAPDVRLPASITSKNFEPNKPKDSHKFELTLKVKSMECREIPVEEFRPSVPSGAEVQDLITNSEGSRYYNQPGKNPFTQSIEELRTRKLYMWMAAGVAIVIVLITCVMIVRRRQIKAKSVAITRS